MTNIIVHVVSKHLGVEFASLFTTLGRTACKMVHDWCAALAFGHYWCRYPIACILYTI